MSSTVGRILADAVDFVREHPGVQRAAVEIMTLVRTLVETRGAEEAKNLLQNMVDKPATKMDISGTRTEVERILAAREEDES